MRRRGENRLVASRSDFKTGDGGWPPLSDRTFLSSAQAVRARRPRRSRDRIFRCASFGSALLVLVLLAGILGSMVYGGWPAFREFGFGFITSSVWDVEQRAVRRLGGDRRHADRGPHRPASSACRSRSASRIFLTQLCPALAASGRSRPTIELLAAVPEHHLRHVGPVRLRAAVRRASCRSRSRTLVEGMPIVGTILYARVPSGVGIAHGRASSSPS